MFYYKYDDNTKLETIIDVVYVYSLKNNNSEYIETLWEKHIGELILEFLNINIKKLYSNYMELLLADGNGEKINLYTIIEEFKEIPLLSYVFKRQFSLDAEYIDKDDVYFDDIDGDEFVDSIDAIFDFLKILQILVNVCNDNKSQFNERVFNAFREVIPDNVVIYPELDYPDGIYKLYEDDHKQNLLYKLDYIYDTYKKDNNPQILYDYFEKRINNDTKTPVIPFDMYNFKYVESCFMLSLEYVCKNEIKIKKCKNCSKYFIPPNRSDTLYCNGTSPQNSTKTCKKYGAEKQYQEKIKNDEASKLYRGVYMSKQMLVKRNPDITAYRKDFEKYKASAKQWKADVKLGVKTEEEFIEWLKSVRGKKYLDY